MKVNGKYQKIFRAFVDAWNTSDWYGSALSNPHRAQLEKAIAGMNPGFLDVADSAQMVTSLVIDLYVDNKFPPDVSEEQVRNELYQRLVGYVESLPRRYRLSIALPNFPSWWAKADLDLAPDVVICPELKEKDGPGVVSKIARALASVNDHRTSTSGPTLQISISGFGDFGSDTPAVSCAVSLAKQVAYLFHVYGVTNRWGISKEAPCRWACEVDNAPARTGMIPHSLSRMFGCLEIEESGLKILDTSNGMGLLGGLRAPQNDDEKISAIETKIEPVRRALKARDSSDYANIAAAMEWYQDAVAADNQTVAFISAFIGVEALIGTEEHGSQMSDRLADRFAFMVGINRADREGLRAEFRQLLNLRGKLVHGRQPRLAAADRDSLNRLLRILDKLIQKELAVILKS